jgi:hypothetical protein
MNNTTPDELEARALDPEAEAVEDDLVAQIKGLVAKLIEGEAAELEAGNPATESLRALVGVICALDWWEEIDEAEDASGDEDEEAEEAAPVADEEIAEDEPAMARARTLADAHAELRALTRSLSSRTANPPRRLSRRGSRRSPATTTRSTPVRHLA